MALADPELAGSFESVLELRAGRFDGAGADGLPEAFAFFVIHTVFMGLEIADFSFKGFALLCCEPLDNRCDAFEPVDYIQDPIFAPVQGFEQRSDPGTSLCCAVALEQYALKSKSVLAMPSF